MSQEIDSDLYQKMNKKFNPEKENFESKNLEGNGDQEVWMAKYAEGKL